MKIIKFAVITLSVLLIFCGCTGEKTIVKNPVSNLDAPSLMLHVEENKIYNERGDEVRLVGVNIPSLEWNSRGDNVQSSVYEVFANWNCNLARIPLSQDYWFGTVSNWSTPYPPDGGEAYRKTVDEVVEIALSFGKYVSLNLQWSNADELGENIGQHFMPDENTLEFWLDAAERYKNNPAVLFNLYSEPRSVSWEVWKYGGPIEEVVGDYSVSTKTLKYTTPGHQKMVDEIRALGANNIIIAGGLGWAYDLKGIAVGVITGITFALEDTPEGNGIVYDSHIYPQRGDSYDFDVLCIKDDHPILIGEIGIEPDGRWGAAERPDWLTNMLDWIDENELHWAGWCFHTAARPFMISDWQYTPTAHHGAIMKERFLSYANTNAHLSTLPAIGGQK